MSAPRKLAAILAADVAGYSRLTVIDEEGTLKRLRKLRRELINPAVSLHRGRIVKTTGDGILIEFPSVVDAVRCALDVQRGVDGRNVDVPPDRRIEFRVGINLGDVVTEGEDLLGDGVNVAARLDRSTEPGGICISDAAYQQVRDKLDVAFEDAGEQHLKNIARPVRVYRVLVDGPKARSFSRSAPLKRKQAGALVLAGGFALLAIGGGATWWWHGIRSGVVEPAERNAAKTAGPLSQQPTVAVLPFLTLSTGPADDYFGDGLTRTSSTRSDGSHSSPRTHGLPSPPTRENSSGPSNSGASWAHVISLRARCAAAPRNVRISLQLVDVSKGTLLWSTQYDAELKDIFSI